MSIAMLTSLLLAGAALPAADRAAIDARVREVFAHYKLQNDPTPAWDYPVFSAETAALIAHWKRVQPADEPDALNDGDWFCLCQDYNEKRFRAVPGAARLVQPDVAEISVRVDIGFGQRRDQTWVLRKEASEWRIDDLTADADFPGGLKQKLRETIAEDEALAASQKK